MVVRPDGTAYGRTYDPRRRTPVNVLEKDEETLRLRLALIFLGRG